MKCPLLLMAGIAHEGEPRCPTQDCLNEICAWWDTEQGQCGMMTIAHGMWILNQLMTGLVNKMPPGGEA